MQIKKFVFVIPNTAWFGKRYWHHFPYTEALLIGVLKQKGYDVEIIDANINNYSEDELREKIIEVNTKITTLVGGIYPTLCPEIITKDKNIDYFIFGEGENRLPALLKAIEAG